jgi:hypothetical protein
MVILGGGRIQGQFQFQDQEIEPHPAKIRLSKLRQHVLYLIILDGYPYFRANPKKVVTFFGFTIRISSYEQKPRSYDPEGTYLLSKDDLRSWTSAGWKNYRSWAASRTFSWSAP